MSIRGMSFGFSTISSTVWLLLSSFVISFCSVPYVVIEGLLV